MLCNLLIHSVDLKIKKREKKIFYPELFCIFVARIRMNCSTNFYKYFRDEKTYF